jgi:hypothetical protein
VSAGCSGTNTTIYAIAHSYNDPVNTVLYRITVPAWLPETNFGDGKNGFFYQVTVMGNTTVTSTYTPFNGVGVSGSGTPQLLPFEFVVAADVTSGVDATSMIIAACSSDYVTPSTGSASTPSCTTMYWADTYSELFTPSVGEPPSGASLSFDTETFSVPNTGVYPATLTVEPSSTSGSTSDADWIYDHLIFADTQGNAYTNNLYDVSAPNRRSFAALTLESSIRKPASTTRSSAARRGLRRPRIRTSGT